MKNVAIIGVGGVGGFFGGHLCQLLQHRQDLHISFVARGEHLRAIQEGGLILKSEQNPDFLCRPSLATDNFESLPEPDLCLLCVKEFDLFSVLSELKPKIRRDTVLLPLLNGIDIYSRCRTIIQTGVVLPACVYVGTHIQKPGVIAQKGGSCKILFGPDPARPDWPPAELLALFNAAKIKSEWTPTVHSEIWKKFIFICAFGLISAARDKNLGQILEDPAWKDEVESVMREVLAVAATMHIALPPHIREESLEKGRSFPYETKTSFQRDFERPDKPDERELFAGALIQLAHQNRVDVPITRKIAEELERIKPLRSRTTA